MLGYLSFQHLVSLAGAHSREGETGYGEKERWVRTEGQTDRHNERVIDGRAHVASGSSVTRFVSATKFRTKVA